MMVLSLDPQASGDMAMHRAADKGPPSAVEALLGAGAEVDPTNKVRERWYGGGA